MSTEIKNTLYRFTTLRAPELVLKDQEIKSFVFISDTVIKGPFHEATSSTTGPKWEAMREIANSFSSSSLAEKELEVLSPELYKLGIWIARNRSDFSMTEFERIISTSGDPLNEGGAPGGVRYSKLWNNLFYQIVTQKDFDTKETILQMLIAQHVLKVYRDKSEDQVRELMYATVVLPDELFVEKQGSGGSISRDSSEVIQKYPNFAMRQLHESATAKQNIENFEGLLKDLKKVHRLYNKEHQTEFTKQRKVYDALHKATWDQYNTALEDAKNNWCNNRNTSIPYDPKNPCDNPPYVAIPEVPDFELDFNEPLDFEYLQHKLPVKSFETLIDLLGLTEELEDAKARGEVLTGTVEEYNGYEDLIASVTSNLSSQRDVILTNTKINTTNYTSFGGVLISSYSKSLSPFSFYICAIVADGRSINFNLMFDVPDSSWRVEYIKCSYKYKPSTTILNGTPYESAISVLPVNNSISMSNIYFGGILASHFETLTSLTVELTFSGGCKKTLTIFDFKTISCFTGTMQGDCAQSSGSDGDETTVIISDEKPFVPSGFGMKQIGIADYKKVEQSVLCYVEGEVSHIENVMARERREKSTRRLRRTETTETDRSEYEKEKMTDSATTDRFEMQTEVSKLLQEGRDTNSRVQLEYGTSHVQVTADAGFATHTTREDNTRQAITQAKEVTQRASERITTKVMQERIEKVIEEFEENNIHEFDNRKGDEHVVGVYRWVDKIYKNQIVNYGKRLMFEFMIPEPAKLHNLGMEESATPLEEIKAPIDPRTCLDYDAAGKPLNLKNYTLINEVTLKYWSSYYNVDVSPVPDETMTTGKGFAFAGAEDYKSDKESFKLPEGYLATGANVYYSGMADPDGGKGFSVAIGDKHFHNFTSVPNRFLPDEYLEFTKPFRNELPISIYVCNFLNAVVNIAIDLKLSSEGKQKWQQECFKAIIDKYEDLLSEYNDKLAEQKQKSEEIKNTNPGFYRQIENMVLRKNCISYMINQDKDAKNTYGKDMTKKVYVNNVLQKPDFDNYEVNVSKDLDDYGAFVKFMEQAFEWNIMSYYFYPYYWGNRLDWRKMYQFSDSDDPLFANFMQAGMARVIVTVRPGFEAAVRFYMQTGLIWNGGAVPVVKDKLFMSIIEELKEVEGKPEGKAWATRIPTSMTILQANSIGLEVEKALPCHCEDVTAKTFDNYKDIPCGDNFLLKNTQINGETGTAKLFGKITGNGGLVSRIMLKTLAGLVQDVTLCNEDGKWELTDIPAGEYDLLLDATNVFPDSAYEIVSGTKTQTIVLVEEQIKEVNLTLHKK